MDQKNRDINKLLLMLRGNDVASSDGGSQRATMGSQTVSESGNDQVSQLDEEENMEIEDEEVEEEQSRVSIPRRGSKRSSTTLGHVSDSDFESDVSQ